MKKTILLTGPIGAGKSVARRYLESLGYPVYDCDSRCKALYVKFPRLLESVSEEIFTDPAAMKRMEETVFPPLHADILDWKKENEGSDLLFIESATALSKRQFDDIYDEVWLIDAPFQTRLSRNPKTALRDSLQRFDCSRVSHVLTNDSTPQELYKKINTLL